MAAGVKKVRERSMNAEMKLAEKSEGLLMETGRGTSVG